MKGRIDRLPQEEKRKEPRSIGPPLLTRGLPLLPDILTIFEIILTILWLTSLPFLG